MVKKGLFIVLEGIDGAGTTTQSRLIRDYLSDVGDGVLLTKEPTERASEIKSFLAGGNNPYSNAKRNALAYTDDRKQHCELEVIPALERGEHVVCDRYMLSTLVYQMTQGVDLEELIDLHDDPRIIVPDITYFVSVDPVIAHERMVSSRSELDSFERDLEFQTSIARNYHLLYSTNKSYGGNLFGPSIMIDGNRPEGSVSSEILDDLSKMYLAWAA